MTDRMGNCTVTAISGLDKCQHKTNHTDRKINILGNIGLLVPQPHGPNKPLVLDRPPGEIVAHKRRFCNHPLPRLLVRLLARIDHLEHLLLADALHLGQRHRKLGRLLVPLVLDGTRQRLGVGRLGAVQQILRQRGLGGFFGRRRLDVLLLLRLDALLHLDLLRMALLLVHLGPQAAQVLGIFGLLVAFTGLALPGALFVVEALAVLLLPALNVPMGVVSVGCHAGLLVGRRTRSEAVVEKFVSCLSVDIMHKQGIVVYNTYHVEGEMEWLFEVLLLVEAKKVVAAAGLGSDKSHDLI